MNDSCGTSLPQACFFGPLSHCGGQILSQRLEWRTRRAGGVGSADGGGGVELQMWVTQLNLPGDP